MDAQSGIRIWKDSAQRHIIECNGKLLLICKMGGTREDAEKGAERFRHPQRATTARKPT